MDLRIGQGWDIHRLVPDRPLIVGGVTLDSPLGSDAHSDGDVLIHALIDALLGALADGDIGTHFPPSDAKWKDADSRTLLRAIMARTEQQGWQPVNIDTSVILETPRLGPHKEAIRRNLASDTGLPLSRVSVKAKSHEKVDAVGESRAIEAQAIVLLKPGDSQV